MVLSIRLSALLIASMWLSISGCTSNEQPPKPQKKSGIETAETTKGEVAPSNFDIRVFPEAGEADSLPHAILITEVDIPNGSYVISALSDRDYLGKFQVIWKDSTIRPAGALFEDPISMPGWEPFENVYTPMMLSLIHISEPTRPY